MQLLGTDRAGPPTHFAALICELGLHLIAEVTDQPLPGSTSRFRGSFRSAPDASDPHPIANCWDWIVVDGDLAADLTAFAAMGGRSCSAACRSHHGLGSPEGLDRGPHPRWPNLSRKPDI
jgi:hypothetical protein